MTSLLRIVLPIIFIINTGFSQSDAGKLLGFLAGQANRQQVVTLVDSARGIISLEPERGREIAKQALELSYAIGDDSCAASALHEVGKGYYFENDYAGALGYWLMALNLREKIGDKSGSVATMNNIGIAFFEISKYEEALKYYFKALKIKEVLGNRRSIANTLNNIGSVYNLLGDTDQALEYYNRSIAINEECGDNQGISINLNNIGGVYKDSQRYDEALECYQRALHLEEEIQSELGVSVVLSNTGDVYSDMGDYDLAMDHYFRSLLLKEQLNDRRGIANLTNNMGKLFFRQGEYVRAEQFLIRGMEMAGEVGAKEYLTNSCHHLYELYQALGRYREAVEHLAQYCELRDEMYDKESRRRIAEMEVVYQLEKKDKDIALLEAESTKHRSLRRLLMVILISVALLSAVSMAGYVVIRRNNKLLRDKNKQLAQAIRLLKLSERRSVELVENNDRFLEIISHDLKNPLTSIVSTSEYIAREFDDMPGQEKKNFVLNIRNSALNLQNLLENLLIWTLKQSDQIKTSPLKFRLEGAVQETMELYTLNADEKSLNFSHDVSHETKVYADREMVETILRNLISNSIKFSRRGGSIKLSASTENNVVTIIVADDGVGIEPERLDKLFDEDTRLSTLGTKKEKGTGLGLVLCNHFTALNGGRIWAESKPGEGAKFIFTLPATRLDGDNSPVN